MCIDYHKLNDAIRKDHFPLSFMDQMLKRLAGQFFYCFLDGYSRYNEIVMNPKDQEKIAFIGLLVSFPTDECHSGYVECTSYFSTVHASHIC